MLHLATGPHSGALCFYCLHPRLLPLPVCVPGPRSQPHDYEGSLCGSHVTACGLLLLWALPHEARNRALLFSVALRTECGISGLSQIEWNLTFQPVPEFKMECSPRWEDKNPMGAMSIRVATCSLRTTEKLLCSHHAHPSTGTRV